MSDSVDREVGGESRGTPLWLKGLLLVSVVLMIGGVALGVMGGGAEASPGVSAGDSSGLVNSFGASDGSAPAPAEDAGGEDWMNEWSPTIFRLGFSFFVGFAVAYAVRTFIKLSVVAAGFVLLLLFGLQYAGIIEVHWGRVADHYDSFGSWFSAQFKSLSAFIGGELPSAASVTAGLVLGFRRG
ncbi:MAG: FUN14 domain-containing protein [Phycisphaerales bacterium JB059]